MECPVCGEKSIVMETRKTFESVHRRRKCVKCGHLFYTQERAMEHCLYFYEVANEYRRSLKNSKATDESCDTNI